ncbi:hypothetical protein QTP86_030837 [Hemibagrus guttatus]|nr:hypothetical protein QTP86_030837 [Hemibagrus guttatus]
MPVRSSILGHFISGTLCRQLRLKTTATPKVYQVHAVTGKPLWKVRHLAGPLHLQVGALHTEEIYLLVLEDSTADIVLGHPWLEQHDPILYWKTGEILKWGEQCFGACFPNLPVPDFMHTVLWEFLHKSVLVYIDDILIYSWSMAEHRLHVEEVIDHSGIRMDEGKVAAVRNWPIPASVKDLQRFLGFANFYRRFICDYSSLTSPLTNLLRNKPKSLTWNPAATQAFNTLKTAFTTARLLVHSDPELPFIVEVDASTTGVGAVLSQQQGNPRTLCPCAFFSQKLSPAEVNYDIRNRELLAIKLALEEWRHWLEGAKHPFVVLTDHKNLEYLRAVKRLNPRQARWALFFIRFHFTISYRPGSKNVKADALSRLHGRDETSDEPEPSWLEETLPEPSAPTNAPPGCPQRLRFIPRAQRNELIHSTHTSLGTGHPGIHGTLSLLK